MENHHLGVNKLGKNIRKSPLHQPSSFHQPQVYNISKNDFRSIVQQLTGTPSRDPTPVAPPPPPPLHQPRPSSSSMRLHKIRPPPLTPIARPPLNPAPAPALARPGWAADSPVSAYMRYLETSLLHSDGTRPPGPSPRPLPSPGSQFPPPPSPSSFLNLLSPRSPYPLLSPNFSFSPLPAAQQGKIGPGPASAMPPPLSPGLFFPSSPSGFFPLLSPRWRDM